MIAIITTLLFIFAVILMIYNYSESERITSVMNSVDVISGKSNSLKIFHLVKRIIDGDTIEIENGVKVRLENIDAYEKNSPLHNEIVDFLSSLIFNKLVKIDFSGIDKYGRNLGTVYTLNGININNLLVSRGYARVYDEYCDTTSKTYQDLKYVENVARINRLGGFYLLLNHPADDRHGL